MGTQAQKEAQKRAQNQNEPGSSAGPSDVQRPASSGDGVEGGQNEEIIKEHINHPIIGIMVDKLLFESGLSSKCSDILEEVGVPIETVAFIGVMIVNCLDEYSTGTSTTVAFSAERYTATYLDLIELIEKQLNHPQKGAILQAQLYKWAQVDQSKIRSSNSRAKLDYSFA